MPEQSSEVTSLTQIADNVAATLFEGSATAAEVMIPENTDKGETQDNPVTFDPEKNIIHNPNKNVPTSELLGDIIGVPKKQAKQTETPIPDTSEPAAEETPFEFLEDLFKSKVIQPFEDNSPIKNKKDLEELIKANIEEVKISSKEEGKKELLEELPEAVKVLVEYAKAGGDDLNTVFKLLAKSGEVAELNTDTPEGQAKAIREYYEDLGWKEEDIEEQINILKDAGPERLKATSERFKEKVNELRQKKIDQQIEQQKQLEEQSKEMQKKYVESLTNTLKKGTVGQLKLSKEEQKDIYSALVEERYPTFDGRATNRLGALLNKIQFQEPDFELLSEVFMLLNNRDQYHEKIRGAVKTDVTVEQVKKIKTEQGLKQTGGEIPDTKRTGVRKLGGISNPFK